MNEKIKDLNTIIKEQQDKYIQEIQKEKDNIFQLYFNEAKEKYPQDNHTELQATAILMAILIDKVAKLTVDVKTRRLF